MEGPRLKTGDGSRVPGRECVMGSGTGIGTGIGTGRTRAFPEPSPFRFSFCFPFPLTFRAPGTQYRDAYLSLVINPFSASLTFGSSDLASALIARRRRAIGSVGDLAISRSQFEFSVPPAFA